MTDLPFPTFPPKPGIDGEPTWDTTQLREDFEVLGFSGPYVAVRRRSDGVKGSLEFIHQPRIYFGWVQDGGTP